MRRTSGRVGGTVAIVLSVLWALGALCLTVFGVLLALSGRDSDQSVDVEGFAEFVGGGMAVVGGTVLAAAIGGFLLGRKVRRAGGAAGGRVGMVLLFGLFAAVSGMFLASAVADERGPDVGGIVGFGLNTALCVLVVVLALLAEPEPG